MTTINQLLAAGYGPNDELPLYVEREDQPDVVYAACVDLERTSCTQPVIVISWIDEYLGLDELPEEDPDV